MAERDPIILPFLWEPVIKMSLVCCDEIKYSWQWEHGVVHVTASVAPYPGCGIFSLSEEHLWNPSPILQRTELALSSRIKIRPLDWAAGTGQAIWDAVNFERKCRKLNLPTTDSSQGLSESESCWSFPSVHSVEIYSSCYKPLNLKSKI